MTPTTFSSSSTSTWHSTSNSETVVLSTSTLFTVTGTTRTVSSTTPAPTRAGGPTRLPGLSVEAPATAACFVVAGEGDTAAECRRAESEEGKGFYKLSLGATSAKEWTLTFEANVESIAEEGHLLGFGERRMMSGKEMRRLSHCQPGSGWHRWSLVNKDGAATLQCDDVEVDGISLPGGYSVPHACSFVVGSSFRSGGFLADRCSDMGVGSRLTVRNMLLSA